MLSQSFFEFFFYLLIIYVIIRKKDKRENIQMNLDVLAVAGQAYSVLSLFLTSYYVYMKVSVIPPDKRYRKIWVIASVSLFISVSCTVLHQFNLTASSVLSYLFPSLFFILFEKEKRRMKSLVAFIASSFVRIVSFFVSIIVSTLTVLFIPSATPKEKSVIGYLILLVTYTLLYIAVFLLMKIKRFRNGFQFFQNENNLGIGLLILGLVFILFGFSFTNKVQDYSIGIIVLIGVLIAAFGLYLWIRRSITAHYRERLQMRSEEHYRKLLKEKEDEIEKLNQSNAFLAKIVHRDNHLMDALGSAVDAYFESDVRQFKDELLLEIQTLAKERRELIEKAQHDSKLLPSTGNILIDSAVSDLYIRATARGIDFDLTVSETVNEIIGKYISQTDLQTLICDHIKDAVIAVEASENGNGKILVELSVKNDDYSITIYDNGADFEMETLAKLGKERVTTHADSGGSGIGFMTTFETLRKAHASLIITEFESKTPFSKSVAFVFNGENRFIIQSYRRELLKSSINRDDIIIL